MKKRITSLLLAAVMVFGILGIGVMPASAASELKTSDDCIKVLKEFEGFSAKPYWDYAQYTVGYGTKCPDDMYDYYMENGITDAEAEVLLRNHLSAIERQINTRIIDKYSLTLSQNQFDALVLFSYNCGTAWTTETTGTFFNAIIKGKTGNDLIRAFALWCNAGGSILTGLLNRRLSEANMYINGVYAKAPPANYDYVLYDANGGTTSPRSQGYDSNEKPAPYPVPTRTDYTFDGWYTAKTGGIKVTALDASVAGMTLYARWLDASGNPPEQEEETPVTVTVTGSDVNLRKGPGTNYAIVGTAQKGDQKVITETASGSGYEWGKFEGGWICLKYTNYDEAVKELENTTQPDNSTDSDTTTQPDNSTGNDTTTQPDNSTDNNTTTQPDNSTDNNTTTQPDNSTDNDTTQPDNSTDKDDQTQTDPEPETPAKVMGTVNVSDGLCVRSGPSTGYSVVRYLSPKARVEILEQKTVGAMVWGKISDGWISMDYVILDKTTTDSNQTTTTAKWTGTVYNCNELLIRSAAGTTNSIVGYLKSGTKVEITERKTVGTMEWGKISKGWISLVYVKLDSSANNSTNNNNTTNNNTSNNNSSSTTTQTITGTVKVSDCLRVRSGPGTSYAVTGYLKPNEKVTITEKKTVGSTVWGKISKGWISLDYVVLSTSSSTTQPTTQTKTVTADCLCVRKGAGTGYSIVGYLYYGAKVTILETKSAGGRTWGRINSGWIAMDYTK